MAEYVVVSGGFDPLHVGHVRMFQTALLFGEKLIVILNNDNWLKKKKGYVFMPEEERAEIIMALAGVNDVIITEHKENDEDTSVCNELRKMAMMHADKRFVFANGGDRKINNIPEYELCLQLGIEMVFNVGGDKVQSSSELVRSANERKK